MQHFLKAMSRSTGAKIVPPEFLFEDLSVANYPWSAFDLGFGRESLPPLARALERKGGRRSCRRTSWRSSFQFRTGESRSVNENCRRSFWSSQEGPPNKPNSRGRQPVLASLAAVAAGDPGGRSAARRSFATFAFLMFALAYSAQAVCLPEAGRFFRVEVIDCRPVSEDLVWDGLLRYHGYISMVLQGEAGEIPGPSRDRAAELLELEPAVIVVAEPTAKKKSEGARWRSMRKSDVREYLLLGYGRACSGLADVLEVREHFPCCDEQPSSKASCYIARPMLSLMPSGL